MRGPVEFGQYTSLVLGRSTIDAGIELSTGSVGDCYDNAMVGVDDQLRAELREL